MSIDVHNSTPPRRRRFRRKPFLFVAAVVLFIGVPTGIFCWIGYPYTQARDAIINRERVLLYRTNHLQVLDACRQLLARAAETTTKASQITYAGEDLHRLPSAIGDLHPRVVTVRPDEVKLEFGGDFYHYGFNAFPLGVGGEGTRQLIPGLWYYSEDDVIPTK